MDIISRALDARLKEFLELLRQISGTMERIEKLLENQEKARITYTTTCSGGCACDEK